MTRPSFADSHNPSPTPQPPVVLWPAHTRTEPPLPPTQTPDAHRTATLFLAALALYFAAHTALRALAGGGLEVDEAEMLVLARGWHLGYGPQLPLYNWLQVAAFDLFGHTAFALAALKNLVLFTAMALLFTGLRRVVPVTLAIAATLSFALIPNIVWEFQRASTHSIALLATVTATIAAVLAVVDPARRTGWGTGVALGLAMGLGGLAKFNSWLVPVSLGIAVMSDPSLRARVRMGPVLGAVVVTMLIVAVPYTWVWQHPGVALASTAKLYQADGNALLGVGRAVGGFALGAVPLAVAALAFRGTGAVPWPATLLLRAAGIGFMLTLTGIILGGVTVVQARWLVPIYALLGPGVMIWAVRAAGPLGLRRLMGVTVAIGVLTLGGMANLRLHGKTTGGIDWAPLAEEVMTLTQGVVPVLADDHVGGNLIYQQPEIRVISPDGRGAALAPARVLLVWKGDVMPDPAEALAARGLQVTGRIVVENQGQRALGYRAAAGTTFPVGWALIATDAP